MFIFILVVLVECLMVSMVMLYRNKVIYAIRTRALDVASMKAQEAIENHDLNNWRKFYDVLELPSYKSMFYNHLEKWRYEDFYKE